MMRSGYIRSCPWRTIPGKAACGAAAPSGPDRNIWTVQSETERATEEGNNERKLMDANLTESKLICLNLTEANYVFGILVLNLSHLLVSEHQIAVMSSLSLTRRPRMRLMAALSFSRPSCSTLCLISFM